jgi:hypothetical protein
MPFRPESIPEVFDNAPKPISPQVHRWLDLSVTSAYAIVGGILLSRGSGRQAAAAFINSGMVAGVSMFTDYEGDGSKPISFKLHGLLDLIQAATAATAPLLFGFPAEPASAFFYSQAGSEVGVVALTDWNKASRQRNRLEFAA